MNEPQTEADATRRRTRLLDPADYLEDEGDVVAYLEAAFEDGDSRGTAEALGDVARSNGTAAVAAKSGLGRGTSNEAISCD